MISLTVRLAPLLVAISLSSHAAWAQARPSILSTKLSELNPAQWVRTGAANYRAGNWIARDLTVHPSFGAALKRSVMPTDRAANMRSVGALKLHGVSLAQSFLRPAIIELQRQAGSGKGFDGGALMSAMHPVPIATTFGASWLGATAGASLQSTLAGFGPVGAVAGVFLRPIGGIGGSLVGYALGRNLVDGDRPFLEMVRDSFADLEWGRDGGNIVGSTIGGILGQTLIPVPVVGGILGSIVGGTIGIAVGEGIASWWERRRRVKDGAPPAVAASGPKQVQLLGNRSGG